MNEAVQRRPRQESTCRITSSAGKRFEAAIRSIDQTGALIATSVAVTVGTGLDVIVSLADVPPIRLAAGVVGCGADGLRLKWTPIHPADSQRLNSSLLAFRAHPRPFPVAHPALEGSMPGGTRTGMRSEGGATNVMRRVEPAETQWAVHAPARTLDRASCPTMPDPGTQDPAPARESMLTRRIVRAARNAPTHPQASDASGETAREDRADSEIVSSQDNELHDTDCSKGIAGGSVSGSAERQRGSMPLSEDDAATTAPAHAPEVAAPAAVQPAGEGGIVAKIQQQVRSVRVADLAARHEHVRVLSIDAIKGLIQESVQEASSNLDRSWSESERKRIFEEAERVFQDRLKEFDAEKLSAEARMNALVKQFEDAQRELEEERSRKIQGDQFTVSPSSLEAIESKFRRMLEHYVAEGKVAPGLEQDLRRVIATVFDQERQRIRELELLAQNDRIRLLEGKIKRLSSSLEETERQRDDIQEWASQLQGGELRNVFTAGIRPEDPHKQRKMALMKEILEINRGIRKALVQFDWQQGGHGPEVSSGHEIEDCVGSAR